MRTNSKLKHADVTERILGVYYDVYNELGHGFLESVYQNAMFIALRGAGLAVDREVAIPVTFRSQIVGEYRADFVAAGSVIVELKAVHVLESSHEVQLFHYLRATRFEVGLLLIGLERKHVLDSGLPWLREKAAHNAVTIQYTRSHARLHGPRCAQQHDGQKAC